MHAFILQSMKAQMILRYGDGDGDTSQEYLWGNTRLMLLVNKMAAPLLNECVSGDETHI
jgi:hypothetical protein